MQESTTIQLMQRRTFPSILLYGFGLALALSLVFNGFLLYEQSRPRSLDEYESGTSSPVNEVVWQQQLSDCQRASQRKDSVILRLAQEPNAPPGQIVTTSRTASK